MQAEGRWRRNDGHFTGVFDLECADDAEAMERAKQLVDGHDVELWQLARKITVFKRILE